MIDSRLHMIIACSLPSG